LEYNSPVTARLPLRLLTDNQKLPVEIRQVGKSQHYLRRSLAMLIHLRLFKSYYDKK